MLLNKYKVKNCKYIEFKKEDLKILEKILVNIRKNKTMYIRVVILTALLLHYNMDFVFANSVDASLDATFGQLINLLKSFAKWGCLGMGLKRLIEEMLSGANFKQASTAGVQYWLCYIFIQIYPKLFDMIKM